MDHLRIEMVHVKQALGNKLDSLVPPLEALSAKLDNLQQLAKTAIFGSPSSIAATATGSSPATEAPPALHVAAAHGDVDAVRRLTAQGEDPTTRDPWGDTALHRAAAAGRVAALDALLDSAAPRRPDGVDAAWSRDRMALVPNARGRGLRTPLHSAAAHGHADAARSLLAHGARLDAQDVLGNTPLHEAAAGGLHHVAAILLDAGAPVDAIALNGYTPLGAAAHAGSIPLMMLLLEKGSELGRSAFPRSFVPAVAAAAAGGNLEAIRVLLGNGMYWTKYRTRAPKAFEEAAKRGHTEVMEMLLDNGVDINTSTSKTALLLAVRGGHADTVDMLLARGASFQETSVYDRRPQGLEGSGNTYGDKLKIRMETSYLVAAAEGGNPNIIKAISIAAQKHENYRSYRTQYVLCALEHARNADVVWALADVESDTLQTVAAKSLPALAEKGNVAALRAVLLTGLDVQDEHCLQALKIATEKRRAECVVALLEAGVKEKDDCA